MSDGELLKRAAEKLRAAVREEYVFVAPWRAPGDGTVSDPEGVIIDGIETPEAGYVALMHPPVALALADWLDEVVRLAAVADPGIEYYVGALAVARAILREPVGDTPKGSSDG